MARLHIYPHTEPKEDMLLVADPAALKDMANAMLKVAQSPGGFQRIRLHTSDGHEYTVMIVADVSEEEWQTVTPAYKGTDVPTLAILNSYQDLMQELNK